MMKHMPRRLSRHTVKSLVRALRGRTLTLGLGVADGRPRVELQWRRDRSAVTAVAFGVALALLTAVRGWGRGR